MARQQIRRKELRAFDREKLFVSRAMAALDLSEAEVRQSLSYKTKTSARINVLAARKPAEILNDLRQIDPKLEKIDWARQAYFISDKAAVAQSDLFKNGEIYIQTASSLIPGIALDPKPGDKIIDLCAAPGGKSCHAASLADGKIELWANDAIKGRIRRLREVLTWQHIQPYELTEYPAQYADKFLQNEFYDKVLLDAQCSGEGRINLARPHISMRFWSFKRVKDYGRLQQRMLKAAYKLLKPGGTLVYSTCTIAPEENELPVDQLLRHTDAVVAPVKLNIPEAIDGLKSWEGNKLDPSIKGAVRVRPSQHMEAFFVCKIRKPH